MLLCGQGNPRVSTFVAWETPLTGGNEQCLVNKHCTKLSGLIELNYNVWSPKIYEIFCTFNLCLYAKHSSIHVWAKNIPVQHVSQSNID